MDVGRSNANRMFLPAGTDVAGGGKHAGLS